MSSNGKYHFLDVGAQKYGDCIVVEFGSVRVLIDGSHEKDFEGQAGFDSTPEQLAEIFSSEATPHPITLMVVTHCHQDHIGALPKLVSEGIIKPKWALITDHKLGFGRTDDDSDSANRTDLLDPRAQRLAAALREEDASDLSDAELEEFMDGAMTVESKYSRMLADLKKKGVKVVEYRGQPLPAALIADMAPSAMTLLGPSRDQLVLAAQQIATTNKEATDAVRDALVRDATLSDLDLYRQIVTREARDAAQAQGVDASSADFANPRGNGMNCQSITLAFGPPAARALLAGDMQFAEPGVKGANSEIAKLRAVVKAAGPFRLFKTTHHTSHNGQNNDILEDLGDPPLIVHSGGSHDASHPFPATLKILKSRSRDIVFARTDRNGLITVEPHLDPDRAVTISKGRVNDFTDNGDDASATAVALSEPVAEAVVSQPVTATRGRSAPQIVIVNLPNGAVDMSVAGVDITVRPSPSSAPPDARVRADGGRSRLTGIRAPAPVAAAAAIKLASGRTLPKLLFVTDSNQLRKNIGQSETASALAGVRAASYATLIDTVGDRESALDKARAQLQTDRMIAGVVILGGYDVIPSVVLDVLPPALRQQLGRDLIDSDIDQFYVWSDDPYGDLDGDRVAERPVSRIPDARDSQLFLRALQAGAIAPSNRFGVRNFARPFADSIWADLVGNASLNVSKRFLSSDVQSGPVSAGAQYFMLHGNDTDATVFSGEDLPRYTRAFSVEHVPEKFDGLVFSGCCWGALSVSEKASEVGDATPAPRVAERSIALSYLKAGANAFVGCTGSHYSGPDTDPDLNYASRFHQAFWKTLPHVGYTPSLALFGARKYYGELIASPNVEREPLDIARRLKNRAQFTCLGLGW